MRRVKKVLAIALVLMLSILMIPLSNVSAAKKVKLNKTKATIYVGKTVTLKLKNNKKKVKWSSSNKKVATVSSKGKVKGKEAGKVTITAKVGKKRWDCKITVKKKKISTKNNNNTNKNSTQPQTRPSLKIQLPDMPYTGIDYSYSNKVYKKYTLSSIRYEWDYDEFSNAFSVKLFVSGTKIYDYNGIYYSSYVPIGWKLYDMNNNVVDSGTIYSPNIAVGESFIDAYDYISSDLKPGNYKLMLINTQ